MEAEHDMFLEKAVLLGTISLSTVQSCSELVEYIVLQIRQKDMNFLWYYLVLDESTDLSSTSHHLVFIRGVNLYHIIFGINCNIHGTTNGIYYVLEGVEHFARI